MELEKLLKTKFIEPDTIIATVDSRGALVDLLSNNITPGCSLIGSKIKVITPPLGKGVEGTVYAITLPSGTSSEFAMKEVVDSDIRYTLNTESTILEQIQQIIYQKSLPRDASFYLALNNIPKQTWKKVPTKSHEILLPTFEKILPCKVNKTITSTIDGDNVPIDPPILPGDYVCSEEIVESVISSFTSSLIERKICPHFTHTISFATCVKSSLTFMEKIDSSLFDMLQNLQKIYGRDNASYAQIISSLNFQVLMALSFMQDKFQICHQDLHLKNVFLLDSRKYSWNGNNLSQINTWRYRIDGVDYYVQNPGFIVKLGDWGFSAKYSHPRVLRDSSVRGDYDGWNIPVNFSPVYDMLFYLTSLVQQIGFDTGNAFNARKCINYIVNGNVSSTFTDEELENYKNLIQFKEWKWERFPEEIQKPSFRPILSKIKASKRKFPTPREVLMKCFGRYTIKPPKGTTYVDISNLNSLETLTIPSYYPSPMEIASSPQSISIPTLPQSLKIPQRPQRPQPSPMQI